MFGLPLSLKVYWPIVLKLAQPCAKDYASAKLVRELFVRLETEALLNSHAASRVGSGRKVSGVLKALQRFAIFWMEGVGQMIRKSLLAFLVLTILAVTAAAQVPAASPQQPAAPKQPPPAPKTHLKVGQPAPDFDLPATDGKTYKLSDFKNKKNVVLAIYVLAFTGG
jgi:hypothetical protein